MSRTVLVSFDLARSKLSRSDVEALLAGLSVGEMAQVGDTVWLVRTNRNLGEVAAAISAADEGGGDRWIAVNVSNRIFAWAGQDKNAHGYMSAINKALQKTPRA